MNIFIKNLVAFSIIALLSIDSAKAQEIDLFKATEDSLNEQKKNETIEVDATFKATRMVHGHSVETTKKGILDFRIHHRFGFVNTGLYELFGLDNASMRMSFDYGITNRLAIGIGRSTYLKQMDGFVKYKLLQQTTGRKVMPISVSILAASNIKTIRNTDPQKPLTTADKTAYTVQAIIAKKFSSTTSFQVIPTMVHYNLVPKATDNNDMFSIGLGARQQLSKRISLTAEYYYQLQRFDNTHNSLAVGVDIETGGHVFQLHFTNATGMTEPTFIHETPGDFFNGDIHFGFNISRSFSLQKRGQSRTSIK